jgi:hypothetical protein
VAVTQRVLEAAGAPARLETSRGPEHVLRALHELATAAAGGDDSTSLGRLVVAHARELLGTDAAALFWWDVEAAALRAAIGQVLDASAGAGR